MKCKNIWKVDSDIIINVENSRVGQKKKKSIELISYYSNVVGYKVDIQNSVAFLFIRDEQLETEI